MKKIIISLCVALISTAVIADDTETNIPPLWDENSPPMSLEQFLDNPDSSAPGIFNCEVFCQNEPDDKQALDNIGK